LTVLLTEMADDPNLAISVWDNTVAADIVIFLVTEELLAALDDLTTGDQIKQEIARKRTDPESRVVVVVLEECSWNEVGSPFQRLLGIPRIPGTAVNKPISKFANKDEAWAAVSKEIRQVIEGLHAKAQAVPTSHQGAVQPTTATLMAGFCPRCSAPIIPGAAMCHACGSALNQFP
jgi:hypothetical protein